MNKHMKFEKLAPYVFVTKLAGFEHTKYIQGVATHSQVSTDDVPMVQGKNIRNGSFVNEHDWYIKKEVSDSLPRSVLNKPCILIPYVGSNLGEVGIFPCEYICHLASNVAKVELVSDKYLLDYVKYYLQSDIGQGYLFQSKQGSAQPNITMDSIRNTFIIERSIQEQHQICSVLSTIDKKIENNDKICSELEAMAKAIYDYWFVQFDFPDENGKPYRTSGGEMVWNEQLKREIPKGWGVTNIGNLTTVVTGKEDANFSSPNGKYKFFTCSQETLLCDTPAFSGQAVLIAGNGDFNVKHYSGEFNAYQRTYVLIPENQVYYGAMYISSKNQIQAFKNGSNGSIVKFITKGDVENIPFIMPNDDSIFHQINKLIEKIELCERENEELTKLRDWLLPMLMNGQARVE